MPFLHPDVLDPPHAVAKPKHMLDIAASMMIEGWVGKPLIGYYFNGRCQLLNGSHRHAAAKVVGLHIPVKIIPLRVVEQLWGELDIWLKLMDGDFDAVKKWIAQRT